MTAKAITGLGLGGLLAINGAIMLAWPDGWYQGVPGVIERGPYNGHFIRDIGIVFIIAGAAMVWTIRQPPAWPAAMAGALFLCAHTGVHLVEAATGHVGHGLALLELPPFLLGAALALWIAWPPRLAGTGGR
ncbi:hypothetical protein [Emcibacter sp. SYSU 3D8]|uniref:hypothetical protein n=1 Tax=Emcibacter sp. SYSU 3D8 TaxID=3133969 RepID=UPI0031FEDA6D